MVQQHRRRRHPVRGAVVARQLDVGEHLPAVALGHEERAALAGRLDGEGGPVHQAYPGGHGVDPETVPGQIDEGRGGDDLDRHPLVSTQHQHRPLGYEGRTGDGVGDEAATTNRASGGHGGGGVRRAPPRSPRRPRRWCRRSRRAGRTTRGPPAASEAAGLGGRMVRGPDEGPRRVRRGPGSVASGTRSAPGRAQAHHHHPGTVRPPAAEGAGPRPASTGRRDGGWKPADASRRRRPRWPPALGTKAGERRRGDGDAVLGAPRRNGGRR